MKKDNVYNFNVAYAGICGSDINNVKKKNIVGNNLLCLGHEIVGVSEQGEYYIINPFFCMCDHPQCKFKSIMFCKEASRLGVGDVLSGFSGSISVPSENAFLIPNNIPPYIGVLTDGIAVVVHALHNIAPFNFNNVAIIGSGTLSILMGIFLKIREPNIKIHIITRREEKISYIENHYSNLMSPITYETFNQNLGMYDLVIEAVGGNQTNSISEAIDAVCVGGTIIVLGAFDESCNRINNIRKLFYKEITVKGINSFCNLHNDFLNAVDLTINNEKLLLPLLTDRYKIKRNNIDTTRLRDIILKQKIIKGYIMYE